MTPHFIVTLSFILCNDGLSCSSFSSFTSIRSLSVFACLPHFPYLFFLSSLTLTQLGHFFSECISLFPLFNSELLCIHSAPFLQPTLGISLHKQLTLEGLKWNFFYRNWSFKRKASRNISKLYIQNFVMSHTIKSRGEPLSTCQFLEICLFPVTLLFLQVLGIPGCTKAMLSNGSDGASILDCSAAG